MLSINRIILPFKDFYPLAACCLAISACSSGGSDEPLPSVVVDDSRSPVEIVSGTLDNGGEGMQLLFEIDEDSTLGGLFEEPSANDASSPSEEPETDSSGDSFIIQSLPQNGLLTLRSDVSVFNYQPEPDFFGEDSFIYSSVDGTEVQVVIAVTPVPDAPMLNRDIETVANQGRLYSVFLEATDADDDEIFFSASGLPDWLTLNARTGALSGIPRQSDIGTVEGMTLTARDSDGLEDTIEDFEISVVDLNDPPSLNITQVPTELFGRESVSFSVFPDDLDNDSVTLSVEPNAAFEATVSGGRIELQVNDILQAVSMPLTIVARDERGAVTREVVTVQLFPRTVSGEGITVSGFREGRGIHIVILGDGYRADQQDTFRDHVNGVLENISSDEGIAAHLGAFNIHMIETVSQQSGSDDSDLRDTVDTAFDSTYNCSSVPRLVCADVLKLFEASLAEYPDVEQIILLVNDPRYGGSGNSGGRVAITSAFFPEIALHEMGHSLADLADEYVDSLILEATGLPPFEEGRFKNVSTLDDPTRVPWAHWIDPAQPLPQFAQDDGVGIFLGGLYRSSGVYRGTFTSRMRDFTEPFGPINTEQWILRLYTLTEGIRKLTPEVRGMTINSGEFQGFSVDPIFGTDVQDIRWFLNGDRLLPSGTSASFSAAGVPPDAFEGEESQLPDAIELLGGVALEALATDTLTRLALRLPPGEHLLRVRVADTSGRIRVEPPHAGIFSWSWRIEVL